MSDRETSVVVKFTANVEQARKSYDDLLDYISKNPPRVNLNADGGIAGQPGGTATTFGGQTTVAPAAGVGPRTPASIGGFPTAASIGDAVVEALRRSGVLQAQQSLRDKAAPGSSSEEVKEIRHQGILNRLSRPFRSADSGKGGGGDNGGDGDDDKSTKDNDSQKKGKRSSLTGAARYSRLMALRGGSAYLGLGLVDGLLNSYNAESISRATNIGQGSFLDTQSGYRDNSLISHVLGLVPLVGSQIKDVATNAADAISGDRKAASYAEQLAQLQDVNTRLLRSSANPNSLSELFQGKNDVTAVINDKIEKIRADVPPKSFLAGMIHSTEWGKHFASSDAGRWLNAQPRLRNAGVNLGLLREEQPPLTSEQQANIAALRQQGFLTNKITDAQIANTSFGINLGTQRENQSTSQALLRARRFDRTAGVLGSINSGVNEIEQTNYDLKGEDPITSNLRRKHIEAIKQRTLADIKEQTESLKYGASGVQVSGFITHGDPNNLSYRDLFAAKKTAAGAAGALDEAAKIDPFKLGPNSPGQMLPSAIEKLTGAIDELSNSVKGNSPKHFARGGFVPGSGSGDTVPAMLTPGEFVLTKDKAARLRRMGLIDSDSSIEALGVDQTGGIQHFANGGTVNAAGLRTAYNNLTDEGALDRIVTNRKSSLNAYGMTNRYGNGLPSGGAHFNFSQQEMARQTSAAWQRRSDYNKIDPYWTEGVNKAYLGQMWRQFAKDPADAHDPTNSLMNGYDAINRSGTAFDINENPDAHFRRTQRETYFQLASAMGRKRDRSNTTTPVRLPMITTGMQKAAQSELEASKAEGRHYRSFTDLVPHNGGHEYFMDRVHGAHYDVLHRGANAEGDFGAPWASLPKDAQDRITARSKAELAHGSFFNKTKGVFDAAHNAANSLGAGGLGRYLPNSAEAAAAIQRRLDEDARNGHRASFLDKPNAPKSNLSTEALYGLRHNTSSHTNSWNAGKPDFHTNAWNSGHPESYHTNAWNNAHGSIRTPANVTDLTTDADGKFKLPKPANEMPTPTAAAGKPVASTTAGTPPTSEQMQQALNLLGQVITTIQQNA